MRLLDRHQSGTLLGARRQTNPGEKRMRPSILLVEDNLTQQKLIQLICQRFGCDIVTCATCGEATEALDGTRFDLVLMDWHLPDGSGIACSQKVRERDWRWGTHTPIVAVTASAMPGDREKCLDAGMDDYLSKPFTIQEFKTMLDRWISKSAVDGAIFWIPDEIQRRVGG
jgi:two-component system sensor histidine kinase/response regulator